MRKRREESLLVILGIEFTYGRELLAGILDRARNVTGLRVRLARTRVEMDAVLGGKERFLAAVGMIWNGGEVHRLRRQCGMTISFANRPPYPADRHILLDDRAIGRLAAMEFRRMGMKDRAVFLPERHFHARERAAGFAELEGDGRGDPVKCLRKASSVLRWLKSRRQAAGVFAINDVQARALLGACESGDVRIPETASLLGVDNDDVYVHLGQQSLSSISLPFRKMGRLAVASALGVSGEPAELVQLPPHGVQHRETTAGFHSHPLLLRRYLEFLQRERPLPSSVREACERCGLPRRSLELAARTTLGKSPGGLLRDERQRLYLRLQSEEFSDDAIAAALGYAQTRSLASLADATNGDRGNGYMLESGNL